MPELFLHIGSNKAGSTAIQAFAAANRQQLAEQGICYPSVGANPRGAHHPLCLSFLDLTLPDHAALREQASDPRIRAQVLDAIADCDRVLLSSEAMFWIFGLDVPALADFLAAFRSTTIILYLRRHDAYLESMYKSRAVVGDALPSFAAFCDRVDRDYWTIVEAWARLPTVHRLVVRPFVPSLWHGQDLIADFLRCIDAGLVDQPWQSVETRNAAEPLPVVDALIRLNHAGVVRARRWIPLLREVTADMAPPPASGYLTQRLQTAIRARYAAGDQRLAAAFWSAAEARAYLEQEVGTATVDYPGLTQEQWQTVLAALREQPDFAREYAVLLQS